MIIIKFLFFINLLFLSFTALVVRAQDQVTESAPAPTETLSNSVSNSLTLIRPKGSFEFRYDLFALPTSRRGHTAFDVPEVRLGFEAKGLYFQKLNLLYDFQESKVVEASIVLTQEDDVANWSLEGGILMRPWFQQLSQLSGAHVYGGLEFYPLARRYKYDVESDKGMSLSRTWKNEHLTVTLSATNGEGSTRNEGGSSKDFDLLVLQKNEMWQWMLGYTWGAYDEYSGAEMRKERIKGFLQYQSGNETAFVELLYTVDPQMAIADRQIAEAVDMSSRLGERIFGQSSRIFYHHSWSGLWGTMIQGDLIRPDVSNRKKDFWEVTGGATYRWNPQTHLWTGVTHASFPEEHSASIRDQQRFSIAMRLVF